MAGIVLVMIGALTLLDHIGPSRTFIGPGAVGGALILVLGPWLWQLSGRAHRAHPPRRARRGRRAHPRLGSADSRTRPAARRRPALASTALARRQERELRRWLYGSGYGASATFADALADAVADIEEAHGARIELASAGDAPLDDPLTQLVLAAREAMANAAKHSTARRDLGLRRGRRRDDRRLRPRPRRRLRPARCRRRPPRHQRVDRSADGPRRRQPPRSASEPGEGTEVELTLPRGDA